MDFKRIFRAPLFWVLAVIVVMLTVFSFDGDGGYTTITTAQAEKLITDKKVDTAVMTTENVLTLDLKEGQTFTDEASDVSGATKVRAEYVDARAEQLVDARCAPTCPTATTTRSRATARSGPSSSASSRCSSSSASSGSS